MKTRVLNVNVVVSFDDAQQFWEAYAVIEPAGKVYPTCRSRMEGAAVSYALTEVAMDLSRNFQSRSAA